MLIFLKAWALSAWSKVSYYVAIAAAVVAFLFFVWLQGSQSAKRAYREKRERARQKAIKTQREIADEVRNRSDADLDRRLDKWMRD